MVSIVFTLLLTSVLLVRYVAQNDQSASTDDSFLPMPHAIIPPFEPKTEQIQTLSSVSTKETTPQPKKATSPITKNVSLIGTVQGDYNLALIRNNITNQEKLFKPSDTVFGSGILVTVYSNSAELLADGERIIMAVQSQSRNYQTPDIAPAKSAMQETQQVVSPSQSPPLLTQQEQAVLKPEELVADAVATFNKLIAGSSNLK